MPRNARSAAARSTVRAATRRSSASFAVRKRRVERAIPTQATVPANRPKPAPKRRHHARNRSGPTRDHAHRQARHDGQAQRRARTPQRSDRGQVRLAVGPWQDADPGSRIEPRPFPRLWPLGGAGAARPVDERGRPVPAVVERVAARKQELRPRRAQHAVHDDTRTAHRQAKRAGTLTMRGGLRDGRLSTQAEPLEFRVDALEGVERLVLLARVGGDRRHPGEEAQRALALVETPIEVVAEATGPLREDRLRVRPRVPLR